MIMFKLPTLIMVILKNRHIFNMKNNFPNPFNPITTLRYELPEDGLVNITVYDMIGNVINQLVNEVQNSGYKSIQWNATNNQGQPVSAGVYLYTIEAGDFRQTKNDIVKIELFLLIHTLSVSIYFIHILN